MTGAPDRTRSPSASSRPAGTPAPPGCAGYAGYAGRTVVFGTRHGKAEQAAEPFARLLGAQVVGPESFGLDLDTDRFGTFSGERPRTLAPLDAALAKAALALEATGEELALASEASYGVLPSIGWPGHEELLVLVDRGRGLQVVERAVSPVVPGSTWRVAAGSGPPLEALARAGWPQQAVLVRADGGPVLARGVTEVGALAAAVAAAVDASPTGTALVEPDLRAQHNPTRRRVLRDLAERLAARLARPCPGCAGPGWGPVESVPGLPCAWCGTATTAVAVTVWGCPAPGCGLREQVAADGRADPGRCPACNP